VLASLSLFGSALPVAAAPSGGALPPPLTLVLHVADDVDVPTDAVGVALNVTVTEPSAPGFLTVYPCGDRPLASNLNYVAAQTVPNFVVTAVDDGGDVCIETMSTTDVVVDIAGYIPLGSPLVPLDAPRRFLDTRAGVGAPTARVAGLSVLAVPIAGTSGVPADAGTVVFNATAVQPSGAGFLTVFPCGQPVPETSSLNFTSGAIVPNLVVSAVGTNGSVCFLSNVDTDIVADVAAYAQPDDAAPVMLDRPHRLVDTRVGLGGPQQPLDPPSRPVLVANQFGVPADATAAFVNLTATNGADAGYAAAFPCGDVPFVSNLNFTPGTSVANFAIVPLAEDGTFCLTANRTVDAVVDLVGYVRGFDAFVPLEPTRIFDSRDLVEPLCGIGVGADSGSGTTFVAVFLDDGTELEIPGQPMWSRLLDASVGPNCELDLLGVVDGQPALYVFGPEDGAARRVATGGNFTGVATSLAGPIVLDSHGGETDRVYEIATGDSVALPPNPLGPSGLAISTWRLVGVSEDGSVFVVTRQAEETRAEVAVFVGGTLLEMFKLAPGTYVSDLSPDGTYLSVITNWLFGGPLGLTVTTLDGTPVASTPGVYAATFTSHGSMLLCVQPPGASSERPMRWDLFSPPTPTMPEGDPSSCRLSDAR
jgi:hypothetical protein